MAEEKKDGAGNTGRKARVKINKSGPARDRRRQAKPVPADMLQPVDYRPPDEEKLKSIREAGFREGRELIEKEKQEAAKPPENHGAQQEGGYIGRKERSAAGVSHGGSAQKNSGGEKAPEKTAGEGNNNESTAPEKDIPSQAKVQEKDQRKGRKKKKAEQKARRSAQRSAGKRASDSAHTVPDAGGGKAGKAAPQRTDTPQAPGQDRLIKGGKKARPSVPRTFVMALSGLLMLYSLSPLAVGVVTAGILPPLCIGAFFFAVAYFWPKICACKKPWFNTLFVACGLAVIAGITLIFYLFGLMYAASAVEPPSGRSDYTVVVLGCKTIGNRPSLMLGDRLDAAAEFLSAHPGAYCIVSGGQGEDELAPESAVMKRYLVSKGISELRIVEERNSFTTSENIENSCAMLDECNLYDDIVVVTDRFHQYRARHYVEKQGLRCYAVNSETRWYLAMHYWFKEMVGVGLMQLGYEI